ncbi:hypothetical protein ACFLYO_03780 [Chloroflexota bacterium]
MRKKMVIIGAGSAMFTQGLVADLIQSPDQQSWTLGLVDIDPVALETAEGLSRKMVEFKGADILIEASIDRRDVLPGADVVVITIGVGKRKAWEQDVFIPRQFGVYQPVGDTAMPGGISRAMRMIPALLDIARDVKALCPDAWFFNYSNPMAANCSAIWQATGIPVVGLCHGTFHVQRELAALLGAPAEEISSIAVGLNHLTFFTDLRWQGRDAWPLLRDKVAAVLHGAEKDAGFPQAGDLFAEEMTIGCNPFSWTLFEAYGAYPAANDRHVTEFFPERFPGGQYYGKILGKDAYSFEDIITLGDEIYDEMRAQATGAAPLDERIFERSIGEHEQLLDILASIERDDRRVFYANLPNQGAVPNLPDDAILEMPTVATAGGLRPIQIHDYPDPLAAVITQKISTIRVTVEAALTGSRELLVEAMLLDGAVTDQAVAEEMVAALLEAQRDYLPNFFQVEQSGSTEHSQ